MFLQHLKKRQVILRLLAHAENWASDSVKLSIFMLEKLAEFRKRRRELKGEWLNGRYFSLTSPFSTKRL